jgi:ectoine hydroxylase-related dioxygenase (phytanoyl-CoA dioxygenase family)
MYRLLQQNFGLVRTHSPERIKSKQAMISKKYLLEGKKCVQPTVKKGSLILRDFRLWHAGMPNPSDRARCVLALGYCANWYHNEYTVPVPKAVEAILNEEITKAGLKPMLLGVPDEEYSKVKHLYNFTFEQQNA